MRQRRKETVACGIQRFSNARVRRTGFVAISRTAGPGNCSGTDIPAHGWPRRCVVNRESIFAARAATLLDRANSARVGRTLFLSLSFLNVLFHYVFLLSRYVQNYMIQHAADRTGGKRREICEFERIVDSRNRPADWYRSQVHRCSEVNIQLQPLIVSPFRTYDIKEGIITLLRAFGRESFQSELRSLSLYEECRLFDMECSFRRKYSAACTTKYH